jgi:hypothetical protein
LAVLASLSAVRQLAFGESTGWAMLIGAGLLVLSAILMTVALALIRRKEATEGPDNAG